MKAKVVVMMALLTALGACSEESKQQAQQTIDNAARESKELLESAKQQVQAAGEAVIDKSQQLYEEGKQQLGEQNEQNQ
jgi:F0F1-type ATP synthase membrane subunit b/b'